MSQRGMGSFVATRWFGLPVTVPQRGWAEWRHGAQGWVCSDRRLRGDR
jgi:hypothetical protein